MGFPGRAIRQIAAAAVPLVKGLADPSQKEPVAVALNATRIFRNRRPSSINHN